MPDRASLERHQQQARDWLTSTVDPRGPEFDLETSLTALLASVAREAAEDMRERAVIAIHGTNTNHSPTYRTLGGAKREPAYAVAHEMEEFYIAAIRALPAEAPTETRSNG